MIRRRVAFLVFLGLCVGCSTAAPTAPSTPVESSPDPRLVRFNSELFIHNAPAAVVRNRLFYVFSATPIPQSTDYPKIGIVRVLDREGGSVRVAWWTLVDEDVEAALGGEGLRVKLIDQDLEKRLNRHWTTFKVTPDPAPGSVMLLLNVGMDDGVLSGDKYELLGEPRSDPLNLSVDDFANLGTCTVQDFRVDKAYARCQLDMGAYAPKVGPGTDIQQGYARAATKRTK